MRFRYQILPIYILAIPLWAAEPGADTAKPAGVTLAECYQRALQVSETLAIDEQDIRQIEAQYRQGVGNILPHISWNMDQLWQDTPGSNVDTSTSSVQSTLLRNRRPESYFQLTQP